VSSEFSPKQALVLWNLLITGEEPKMSEVKPELRKPLVEAGLIRLDKRGRSNYIVLEDKAWDWAVDNFDAKLSRSYDAVPILQTLLVKLSRYLNTHQVSLAEILTTSETAKPSDESPFENTKIANSNDLSTDDLVKKICQAYFSVPDGEAGFPVRLHELRQHLSSISSQQTNDVLLAMQQRGEISLRRAEDLQELNADDEAAAIDMGDGDKRYFIRMKR
jgi:hypothetical protein